MLPDIAIYRANNTPKTLSDLTQVLIDCVEGGASVSFMLPLTSSKSEQYWQQAIASAEKKERVILVAEDLVTNTIIGTVQIILNLPENQPHRADISKMLVHRNARKRGIGGALLRAVDEVAVEEQRSLLVLDTATGSDAERLYDRNGWKRLGEIPEFALWPTGELCSTTVFYRRLSLATGKHPNS